MSDEELQLEELLRGDFTALAHPGWSVDGFATVEAEMWDVARWGDTMRVITRGPSGQHYRWFYYKDRTEHGENECEGIAVPVNPVEKTVTDWQVVE